MRLRDLLDETDFLDGRTVFLDGFSDFTALQQQILAAILAHAEAVHVSVLTSGGEQAACQTGNETKKRLQQLAARQGVEAAVCRGAVLAGWPVFRRPGRVRCAAEYFARPGRQLAGRLRLYRAADPHRRGLRPALPRFYRLYDR